MLCQLLKALDLLGVLCRDGQGDLVFQQIHPAAGLYEVQLIRVFLGLGGSIQLVHLFLTGADEQVTDCPLLDLGLEGAGRVKIEPELHLRVIQGILLPNGGEGLGQRSRSKHGQLHRLGRCAGCRALRRAGSGTGSSAAPGQHSTGTDTGTPAQKAAAGKNMILHTQISPALKNRCIVFVYQRRAHSPARPAAMRTPCSRVGRM